MTLHRRVSASILLTSAAALVLTSVAIGSTRGTQAAAAKSQVAIKGSLGPKQNASFIYTGRFILVQNRATADSGSAAVRPSNGTGKFVDGQYSAPVIANATLKSKKGTLGIFMRGVTIEFGSYAAENGTWKITTGSGIYAGWTGGGRWAAVGTPAGNYIEWDGFVTQ